MVDEIDDYEDRPSLARVEAELDNWCLQNGLQNTGYEELIDLTLSAEQRAWLERWRERYDAVASGALG